MKQKITCARVGAPRVPNCFYELIKMSQMQAPEGKLFIARQVIRSLRVSQKAMVYEPWDHHKSNQWMSSPSKMRAISRQGPKNRGDIEFIAISHVK